MTIESLLAAIDSERARLLPLKDDVSSPYLQQQCALALNDLKDRERFFLGGVLDNPSAYLGHAQSTLQSAQVRRIFVEECVRKWGRTATAAPYDLRS